MISVIMVTNRKGSVKFLKEQLDKQTFKDFEVIIADDIDQEKLYDKQFKPRQPQGEDVWNLNKAYNDCLDMVEGDLIVYIQDFIWIPANALQRFWDLYEVFPNDLITGVGHKYENLEKIVEIDDRANGERKLVASDWTYYELNYASAPSSLKARFEEDMDTHYGGENQIYALLATIEGSKVWIDRENECKGLSQSECGGRPDNWEEKHSNKGYLNEKIAQIVARYK